MKSFVGLLKREWLEHRSAFVWAPASVLLIMLVAALGAVMTNHTAEVSMSMQEQQELHELTAPATRNDLGAMEIIAAMTLDVAGSTDAELREKMGVLQYGMAQPFHLIFIIVAIFTLLASLYDERKDSSILFWKSMPVSDVSTVLSKAVFVLWVAPLVTIGAILVAQFVSLSLVSLYVEEGMGGRVWAASGFWWQPLSLLFGYLQLGLWWLPFAGWIMLVSALAKKLPILWALGIPWVLVVLEEILFGSRVLATLILGQLRSWAVLSAKVPQSAPGLFSPQLWGGVIVGLLLLAGAVYGRRRYNEI